jgi:chromosome segregation ATPase
LSRLKAENEKLAEEKNSELLALLQEKNFVWNQFNKMENDYSHKLRSKQDEVEKANEKINTLVSNMEQLQSENTKKDSRISELESKVAHMDSETKRLNKEKSGLMAELESLRKLKNSQVKPFLNRCTSGSSDSGIVESNRSRRNTTLKKEKDLCTPSEHASTSTKSSEKVSHLSRFYYLFIFLIVCIK